MNEAVTGFESGNSPPKVNGAYELVCTRCGHTRWPVDPAAPFVCHRCRAVLAGKNAVDPRDDPSPAQQAARLAAGDRLRALRAEPILSSKTPSARRTRRGVAPTAEPASGTRMNSGDQGEGFDGHATSKLPAAQGRHGLKGGRPRTHSTDTARQTAAKRAYRARKTASIAAGAVALVALV
jgi:hypothetical protein